LLSLIFKDALSTAKSILAQSPRLNAEGRVDTEAEQLVICVYRQVTKVNLSRLELFSKMGSAEVFPPSAVKKLLEFAQRRVDGIPLQHLMGTQWFWEHEYEVNSAVLVPRPETEVLLDTVIKELSLARIIPEFGFEIGLGSGALSIELLSYFPKLRMIASELTDAACTVANKNAERILGPLLGGKERLSLVRPNHVKEGIEVFKRQGFYNPADFILSNPPYIAAESEVDADVLLHEPHEALFAPEGEPLFFYKNIVDHGQEYLKPKGFVFLEIPHERSQLILKQFLDQGWFAKTVLDLTGRDRVLIARLIPLEDY
jgi:release factor glutamine methyltransferase